MSKSMKMSKNSIIYISEILDELPDSWNYQRNQESNITPETTPAGSHKILTWWTCDRCKSSYPMYAASKTGFKNLTGTRRIDARACPACNNTKVSLISGYNDLNTLCNELVNNYWDYNKNNAINLFPNKIGPGSGKKAWWKCEYGHSYSMRIVSRTGMNSSGKQMYTPCTCPICSGQIMVPGINDLATVYPDIANTWDYSKNKLLPNQVHCGSGIDAWWKCKYGHSYKREVWSRVHSNLGCPVCSGRYVIPGETDIKTLASETAAIWDYNKNHINPTEATLNTHTEYWFKCNICGNSYQSLPFNVHKSYMVTGTCNCPVCHNSAGERALGEFINDIINKYKINAHIERNNRAVLSDRHELDIFIPELNLAFEFNGVYWHSIECTRVNSNVSKYRDHNKAVECYKYGIRLITIYENEWAQYSDQVKLFIESAIINAYNIKLNTYTSSNDINFEEISTDIIKNELFTNTYIISKNNIKLNNHGHISYISYQIDGNIFKISLIFSGYFESTLNFIESFAKSFSCKIINIQANLDLADSNAIKAHGYDCIRIIKPELLDITNNDITHAKIIKHDSKIAARYHIYSCGKMVFEKKI